MNKPIQPLDITVENLTVTYNNAKMALYNANCHVHSGTITALVGPNGGGKSTLVVYLLIKLKKDN